MRSDPAEQGGPPATTPGDVRRWLVGLFLELPTAAVYAASRSKVGFIDPDKSPSAFDWPTLAAEVLGARSRERLWLLTWARCEARRQALARNLPNPPAGGSIREFCHEFGVHRATFNRTVERSLAVLAREWDRRRGIPVGKLPGAYTRGAHSRASSAHEEAAMHVQTSLKAPTRGGSASGKSAYRTPRARAWRNAMVAAINAGLELGLFGVEPGENLWPGYQGADADHRNPTGATYRFKFDGDVPAIAWVGDAGFDELTIHVALWPTSEAERWIVCNNAGRLAGEIFASGWLERRNVPYLQASTSLFTGRRERIAAASAVGIEPRQAAYKDHGRVIL